VLLLGWGPTSSTSMLTMPSDVPSAPGISCTYGTGASRTSSASVSRCIVVSHNEVEGTMARSPALAADSAIRGKCGDVTERTVG
jgi:hypothetical protein